MRYYEGARSHRINEWIGVDGGYIKTSLRPFAVRKSILLVWQCYQPSTNTHAHNLFESTLIFTHKYFAFDFFFFHSAISIPIFVLSSMYSSVYSFSSTYTRPSYSINSQNIIIAQNFFSVFVRFFLLHCCLLICETIPMWRRKQNTCAHVGYHGPWCPFIFRLRYLWSINHRNTVVCSILNDAVKFKWFFHTKHDPAWRKRRKRWKKLMKQNQSTESFKETRRVVKSKQLNGVNQ